jgi:hypothetical protein
MEDGIKSLPQPIRFLGTSTVFLQRAPVATPNYGVLNIGGPFDGISSGRFSGNSNGNVIAVNVSTGFTGNFIDLQLNGVSQLKLAGTGLLTASGGATINNSLTLNSCTFTVASNSVFLTNAAIRNNSSVLTLGSTGDSGILTLSAAGSINLTVKGAASQSVDLQQWQDSSANVLTKIDASGHFGVGTASPQASLHIADTTTAITRGVIVAQHNTGIQSPLIIYRKSRGTEGSPTAVGSADFLGLFMAYPYDGSQYLAGTASFGFLSNGTVSTGTVSTDFFVATSTAADGSATNKRLYIKSDGTVGIGLAVTSPTAQLDIRVGSSSSVGQVIRGASSQSGDLTQWQSSTPTTLAKVDASGNGFFNALTPTSGAKITSGSGAPSAPGGANPAAGDYFFRTDTPSTSNQRIYVCTVGGASPTWVGIV